jgi:hypothetical protein
MVTVWSILGMLLSFFEHLLMIWIREMWLLDREWTKIFKAMLICFYEKKIPFFLSVTLNWSIEGNLTLPPNILISKA